MGEGGVAGEGCVEQRGVSVVAGGKSEGPCGLIAGFDEDGEGFLELLDVLLLGLREFLARGFELLLALLVGGFEFLGVLLVVVPENKVLGAEGHKGPAVVGLSLDVGRRHGFCERCLWERAWL